MRFVEPHKHARLLDRRVACSGCVWRHCVVDRGYVLLVVAELFVKPWLEAAETPDVSFICSHARLGVDRLELS